VIATKLRIKPSLFSENNGSQPNGMKSILPDQQLELNYRYRQVSDCYNLARLRDRRIKWISFGWYSIPTSFPLRNIPIERSVLRIPRNVLFTRKVSIPCFKSIKGSAISWKSQKPTDIYFLASRIFVIVDFHNHLIVALEFEEIVNYYELFKQKTRKESFFIHYKYTFATRMFHVKKFRNPCVLNFYNSKT